MPIATLAVLGSFSLSVQSTAITHFPTEKVRALFAYLALEPCMHRREALAELLWPENAPGMALKNLRLSLYRVRQVLEAAVPHSAESLLHVTHQMIGLDCNALWVDALHFQGVLRSYEQHQHPGIAECPVCLARLREVAAVYQGELLPDLYVPNAPAFDEWLLLRREGLHTQAQQALHTLTDTAMAQGQYAQAMVSATQALNLDAYHEENHRRLMTLFVYLGQPQRALAQYRQCCRLLRNGLDLEPAPETIALMEQIQAGRLHAPERQEQDSPVALASAPTPMPSPAAVAIHNTLPSMLTGFVGRQRELTDLTHLFAQPDTRLITMTGVGGMGKTRLAIELARSMLASFSHGVAFVALASLDDPSTIASTLATTLGLDMGGDALQQLCQYLRDKHMFLILDNAEHLLDRVGELSAALLEAAAQLHILVTSREQLQLRGEYVYNVPALDSAYDGSLIQGRGAASVTLFVQCAQRAQTGFRLTSENLTHVLRICQLVQGMPLGLELAAAWVGSYSLSEIAAAIAQNADFLAYNWRDVPERQRSMRAVFNWSWKLLTPAEQHTLRQVAVFRGSFSLDAAQAVAQASQAILIRLTQTSLLYQHEHILGRRYSIHALLHQFAAEQYEHADERSAVEARHSRYYLGFLAAHERRLTGEAPRAAAAAIQAEIDNIRQAWIWAVNHACVSDIEQCANALYQFYAVTGHQAERVQTFEPACRSFQAYIEHAPEDRQLRRVLGQLLALYSTALARQAQNEHAIQIAQQAIALEQWNLEGAALAFIAWGYALHNQGQHRPARDRLEHALERIAVCQHNQEASELLGVIGWATHLWLGFINSSLSEFGRGREHAFQAWQICQAQQRRLGEVDSLCCLGSIALAEYDLRAAQSYYEEAYQLVATMSSRMAEWELLFDLGEVVRLQGNYAHAYVLSQQALALAHDIGNAIQVYLTTAAMMRLLCFMGDKNQAMTWYQHLLALDDPELAPTQRMFVLRTLMIYFEQSGDQHQVLTLAEEHWALGHSYGHIYDQAQCLILLGHARAMLQQSDAAASYRQALTIYTAIGNPGLAAEAWAGLASIALQGNEFAEALQAAECILQAIDAGVRIGLDEPFCSYMACYRVLSTYKDSRAEGVLQAAHSVLQGYADQLGDSARQAFLGRVLVKPFVQQVFEQQPMSADTILMTQAA